MKYSVLALRIRARVDCDVAFDVAARSCMLTDLRREGASNNWRIATWLR
jgi:hypothetical protein